MYDLVCEVDCGNRDSEIVCGRWFLDSEALHLTLDWYDVLIFSAIYGAGASLHFDGLGDG